MQIRSEAFISGYKDQQLYFQNWAHAHPKATLIITHGQGEHSGSYTRVVECLKDLPLDIYGWDLRGHGKSEGTRGFVKDFDDYSYDFEALYNYLKKHKHIEAKPIFVLGHSMGGLIQVKTLLDHPEWKIKAQVLSSPLFGLTKKVPAIKDFSALALNYLAPQVTLWNEIKNSDLSRDPKVVEEFKVDAFRHDRISSGAYLGFFKAQRSVFTRIKKLHVPTFLQITDHDPVVSTAKNIEFFEKLDCEKKLQEYPGRKHEIYNDLDREVVLKDLHEYLIKSL